MMTNGTSVGSYQIVASLGAGGMGEVYRARDAKLGRDVAIKVLPTAFSENSERLRRFEQEAQAAGALNHPNILSIYHIGTNDGRVKILDFGLAKLTSATDETSQTEAPTRKVNTDPGTVMGTMGYMSPEQLKGQTADHRSDIFSFGAILYEMLSGKRAFRGDSIAETMSAILREDPSDLSET